MVHEIRMHVCMLRGMYASGWFSAGIPKYTYLVYTPVLFVVKWRQYSDFQNSMSLTIYSFDLYPANLISTNLYCIESLGLYSLIK